MKTLSLFRFLLIAILIFNPRFSNAQSGSDPCWAFSIDGNDPPWPGTENPNISDAGKMSDGFVIAGTAYQDVFPSRNGHRVGRTNYGGLYIAKYDFNGDLEWLDYGIDSNYLGISQKVNINSVAVDGNDNIYICGLFRTGGRFWYNGGASQVKIATSDTSVNTNYTTYFIAKLDKHGNVLWHSETDGQPWDIAYAPNGTVVVAGEWGSYYEQAKDTTHLTTAPPFSYINEQYLLWIDTLSGKLKKYSRINENGPNYEGIVDIVTDKLSNVFAVGGFDRDIRFYAPGKTDSLSIGPTNPGGFGDLFYGVKYDSTGKPQWVVSDFHGFHQGMRPADVQSDADGNYYVVGNDGFWYGNDTSRFYNADSSSVVLTKGAARLYKIDKNGFLTWYTGGGITTGTGICVTDTGISMIGFSYFGNRTTPLNDTFYSANGNGFFKLPNENPSIAIANYDTDGNIINASCTGISNGPIMYGYIHAILGDNRSKILFGDGSRYNGTDSTVYYRDTVLFNGIDGLVIKSTPGICDTVNMPPIPPHIFFKEPYIDTVLCGGDKIVVKGDVRGVYPASNIFSAYLIDANIGSSSAQLIGTLTGPTMDSIICTIPSGVATGNRYHVYLTASSTPSYMTASNAYNIQITKAVLPWVSITAYPGTNIQPGTQVTFTAIATNAGNTPSYQWKLNNTIVPGATTNQYITDTVKNGDIVSVVIHGMEHCSLTDSALGSVNITTTGINNKLVIDDLSLYPNPNNGVFTINGTLPNGNTRLEILNNIGQSVYTEDIFVSDNKLHHTIPLASQTTTGVYLLRIINEGRLKIAHFSVVK